jgi:hypothetical protein
MRTTVFGLMVVAVVAIGSMSEVKAQPAKLDNPPPNWFLPAGHRTTMMAKVKTGIEKAEAKVKEAKGKLEKDKELPKEIVQLEETIEKAKTAYKAAIKAMADRNLTWQEDVVILDLFTWSFEFEPHSKRQLIDVEVAHNVRVIRWYCEAFQHPVFGKVLQEKLKFDPETVKAIEATNSKTVEKLALRKAFDLEDEVNMWKNLDMVTTLAQRNDMAAILKMANGK